MRSFARLILILFVALPLTGVALGGSSKKGLSEAFDGIGGQKPSGPDPLPAANLLAAYWTMDTADTTAATVSDRSGNGGGLLTLVNGPTVASSAYSDLGQKLTFAAASSQKAILPTGPWTSSVNTAGNPMASFTTWSLAAHLKAVDAGSTFFIGSKGTFNIGFMLYFDKPSLRLILWRVNTGIDLYQVFVCPDLTDTLHDVVVSSSPSGPAASGGVEMYVDGTALAYDYTYDTGYGAPGDLLNVFELFHSALVGGRYDNGTIDEFSWWNSSFTAAGAAKIHALRLAGTSLKTYRHL